MPPGPNEFRVEGPKNSNVSRLYILPGANAGTLKQLRRGAGRILWYADGIHEGCWLSNVGGARWLFKYCFAVSCFWVWRFCLWQMLKPFYREILLR